MVTAILGAFFSGVTIVLGRMCNARLAQKKGVPYSSLMNYVMGLMGSLILLLAMGGAMQTVFPAPGDSLWLYLGGVLGVIGVYLLNIITTKLPATQLTLLIFVGQLFSGLLLDLFISRRFSPGMLVGGLLVLAGLAMNIAADKENKSS